METWSDEEVTTALQHLGDLVAQMQTMNTTLQVFFALFVTIKGIEFGYAVSHYFLPTKQDIGGQ